MKKFIFVYTGGSESMTEEENKKVMAAWMKWFETLGANLVDGGFPFIPGGKSLDTNGVSESTSDMTGYSIVKAENYEKALEMAKGCPHLSSNTKIHVFEEMEM